MKRVKWNRIQWMWRVLFVAAMLGGMPAQAIRADASDTDTIMELARAGRNREAINAFEALPADGGPYALSLLRAVAGCYWREREFDVARELYNEILERRPTLQGLVPEDRARPQQEERIALQPEPEPIEAPPPERAPEPVVESDPALALSVEAEPEATEAVAVTPVEAVDEEPPETPVAVVEPEPEPVEEKGMPTAVADVEPVAPDESIAAEPDRAAVASGLDQVLEALRREYLEIESRAREREAELRARMKVLQAATETAVVEADGLKRGLETERDRRLAIEAARDAREAELESRSLALAEQLEAASAELAEARATLERADIARVESDAAQAAAREVLNARIGDLTEATAVLHGRMDELHDDLDRERGISRELKTWREAREVALQEEVEALASAAIENALREIDQLEREYAELDAASLARQADLQAQIAMLMEKASLAQLSGERLASDLERERVQRKALEAREVEREKALNEAQFALRTVTSGVLEQLERIHNELVAHKTELRISHERERELADMVPVLNQLEAAAREAAEETAALRQRIEEQATAFEAEREAHREAVAGLDQRIEEQATAFEAEREAHREAVAGLDQRIGTLAERNAKLDAELTDTQAALVASEAAVVRLRERLELFETAFSSSGGTFDPDLLSGIERIIATIAQAAQDDPALAVKQFERLPESTHVPVSLLKTIAGIHREQRDFTAALALYERVLALEPGDPQTERRLVMTLFDMGKYDEALARLGDSGAPARASDK